jgi:hypothetical protein
MRIFLDTEFTSLESPKLISIGMVSEDGKEFYREFSDGWELVECTLFVIGWVLPWLSGGKVGETLSRDLDKHLDLVQLRCDSDNMYPKGKDEVLVKEVEANSELFEHLKFLMRSHGAPSLLVMQNPFLLKRIGEYQLHNLLVGNQAKPTMQISHEITVWLNDFDDPSICIDSEYDQVLFEKLLGQPIRCEMIVNTTVRRRDLQLHHALDDAKALRLDWLAKRGLD